MYYVHIVLLCAIFLATSTDVFAKKYYPQTDRKLNWARAFQHCAAQDLQLATVNSAEEQQDLENAISANLGETHEWFWIAGTDMGKQGEWVWMSTGRPLAYNKWAVGQPDLAPEKCMHVWESGRSWNNWFCHKPLYFICEDVRTKMVKYA